MKQRANSDCLSFLSNLLLTLNIYKKILINSLSKLVKVYASENEQNTKGPIKLNSEKINEYNPENA